MLKKEIPKKVRRLLADFHKWPESWMGTKKDFEYGKKLLPFMEKFMSHLMSQKLSQKKLEGYIDNLWLLGGTIIKEVSIHKEYKKEPLKKLMEAVEHGGCFPDGYENMTDRQLASFGRICGNFEEFLRNS